MFALLILVLLVGSANAATIEEEFEVSQGESVPDDTTPRTLTLTGSPENPTADQQISFSATASDRTGIDRIEILVNAEKVKECPDSDSCTYRGGTYPDYAGISVSYHQLLQSKKPRQNSFPVLTSKNPKNQAPNRK